MKKILAIPLALSLVCAKTAIAADEIHWTITGQDSVTINWHGTASENALNYRLGSGAKIRVAAKHPTPMPFAVKGTFWEAKITGLKENSQYAYSIGSSAERNFKTPPPRGAANFTVYAQGTIGDTGRYFNTGVIQDMIAAGKPSVVIGLGDLSLGSSNGQASVHQHFNDVMAWSKQAAYMPVWGDVDARNTAKDNFKNYKGRFAVPNSQASPGSPLAGGEDWYWFDYGNTRFITLPEPWVGAWADWKTKADKLMAEAQAAPGIKFIVTFVHRPAYSSGHYAGSAELKGILDSLGDRYNKYVLNVNSHSTDYERSNPQHGVVHVTAGIGGQNLMQDGKCLWLTCNKPAWSAFRAMHQGALKLYFSDTAIAGSFICGPAGGGVNDVKCTKGSVIDKFNIAAKSTTPTAVKTTQTVTAATVTSMPLTMAAAVSTASCNKITFSTSSLIKEGSYAYRINKSFGTPADSKTSWVRSQLRVFENGVEIGPGHTGHAAIRASGGGRYSHWVDNNGKESLRFSATNNSNPATNGRTYAYCVNGTAAVAGDTQAPSVPASVKATAVSASQINISWVKSTDNAGVSGYRIFRNGSQLANTTYLSFPSTGLSAGTSYSYTVAAYDAAGNVSSQSATVTAKTSGGTTTTTPPPATTASCARTPGSSVVVNVRDKGATPNDSSNDTTAIQAAIDQAASTGGTAYVPDGTYMIDTFKRVMMKSGVTLKMSSGAVLKAIGSNRSIYDVIRVEYVSNVNIIGGTVQGDRYSHSGTGGEHGHGIEVWGGKNVVIEGLTTKDAWGDGVYVGAGAANVTLCSVIADNNRRQGLTLTSVDGVLVKNSVFKNSNGTIPYAGIDIEPNVSEFVRNVRILNSQMSYNKGPGLQFGFSSSQAAATSGIANVTVDGNTIANNGVPGSNYYASGVVVHAQKGGIVFSNNIVKNSAQDGIILVGGTKNARITGNTVTGSGFNNNVDRNIGNGILIWDPGTTGNVVINNTIYGNRINLYDGVGGNTISPNTIN